MTDVRAAALFAAYRLMRDLEEGRVPDLATAPELDDWLIVEANDGVSLIGKVTGHPNLGDGRLVQTSALIAIAKNATWARTLNRFYRLKRPLGSPAWQ